MIPLRDENPTERIPIVTIFIIATCILIFFYEMSLPETELMSLIYSYGVVPVRLFSLGTPLLFSLFSIFTSMFLHGGPIHLLGNMLYLWIFGNNIEDRLGKFSFLLFYSLCGIAAALVQSSVNPASNQPMIGASGAIAGVLGAYLILFPGARILTLIPLFFFLTTAHLPAYLIILLWFLIQLFSSAGSITGVESQVAYFAHIGGFIAGLLLIFIFPKKKRKPRVIYPDHLDYE